MNEIQEFIEKITNNILTKLINNNLIIVDKIKLQNAIDSLDSMIEAANTYYLRLIEEYPVINEHIFITALKEDIKIAKKSWEDLKYLIGKDYEQ